jgi:hypothetical protein
LTLLCRGLRVLEPLRAKPQRRSINLDRFRQGRSACRNNNAGGRIRSEPDWRQRRSRRAGGQHRRAISRQVFSCAVNVLHVTAPQEFKRHTVCEPLNR